MKKFISVFIALIMTLSLVLPGVSAFADETVDYSDNASVPKVNLVADPDNLNAFLKKNGTADVGEYKEGDYFTWVDKSAATGSDANFIAGPSRLSYKSNGTPTGHFIDGFNDSEGNGFAAGKTYVYSIGLKNTAPQNDPAPLFGMAFGWYRADALPYDALVYFPVENTQDYETYTGYYTSRLSKNNSGVSLGFAYPDEIIPYTAKGASITMDISKGGSLFIAEEAATEITNVAVGGAIMSVGGQSSVKAEVLNQIGEKGNIAQNISWTVLNEDRTAVSDGISLTDNGDGTASITGNTEGSYVILASSGNLRKGVKITVVSQGSFTDNAILDKGNLIKDPDNLDHLSNTTSQGGSIVDKVEGSHITWQDIDVPSQSNIPWMAGPTYLAYKSNNVLKGHFVDGFGETTGWTVGETFVWSVRLKNSAPDKDATPSFGMSFDLNWNNKDAALVHIEVDNTEYETYTGYYTSVIDQSTLNIGFTCLSRPYTAVGGQISMDLSKGGSLMVAKEAPTEIKVTAENDGKVEAGKTISLSAEVLNQIGEKGNVSQDVSWAVLTSDRTQVAEGFALDVAGDGTAEVTVPEDASGEYVVFAMSDASELRKGVTINVVEPQVVSAGVNVADGMASFEAALVENVDNGREIMFVIASYDDATHKMIDAEKAIAAVEDGIAVLPETLEITVNTGNRVRIFAWYADTFDPIGFADDVESDW